MAQIPAIKLVGQVQKTSKSILSNYQLLIVNSVQEILFPDDENGPGAADINASDYLIWVLSDTEKDPDEVQYIINGIGWVDETAEEEYSKKYFDLSQNEREHLIAIISKEAWGESWLSVILTFIFEALLCDPQYGGNPESIGWKWLEHNPGQPRPKGELLYPEVLNIIRKS